MGGAELRSVRGAGLAVRRRFVFGRAATAADDDRTLVTLADERAITARQSSSRSAWRTGESASPLVSAGRGGRVLRRRCVRGAGGAGHRRLRGGRRQLGRAGGLAPREVCRAGPRWSARRPSHHRCLHYLIRQIDAADNIDVRHRTEVVDATGDGRLTAPDAPGAATPPPPRPFRPPRCSCSSAPHRTRTGSRRRSNETARLRAHRN